MATAWKIVWIFEKVQFLFISLSTRGKMFNFGQDIEAMDISEKWNNTNCLLKLFAEQRMTDRISATNATNGRIISVQSEKK